jgi:hypothetical protein
MEEVPMFIQRCKFNDIPFIDVVFFTLSAFPAVKVESSLTFPKSSQSKPLTEPLPSEEEESLPRVAVKVPLTSDTKQFA